MKKNILFNIILLILSLPGFLGAQEIKQEKVSEGIIHYSINNLADTLVAHILDINLDSCRCSFDTYKAKNKIEGLQTTSSMADADSIIAGVNADFFEADGSIINNMISGGSIIKALSWAPYDRGGITYSQFAMDYSNHPFIERFNFWGTITSGSNEYSLFGINVPLKENVLILFNSYYNSDLPEDENLAYLKLISPGKYLVHPFNDESVEPGDFLLYKGKETNLQDTVTISYRFNPELPDIKLLSGGWPRLVKDGTNFTPESKVLERTLPGNADVRHPRTGIGFSKDSTHIFLFTVDGRQKSSKGMTISEFADMMLQWGVYQGMNFDGGGSTAMVIKGEVVNNPSDFTGERKVGSALIIIKNKGTF